MDIATLCSLLNPAQQRVVEGLLGWRQPRPAAAGGVDDGAGLRQRIEAKLASAAALIPAGRMLSLGKSGLDALGCDGRYLDYLDSGFAWSHATIRGQLAHLAIEFDHAGGRQRPAGEVVAHAWQRVVAATPSAGRFVAGMSGVAVDALRAAAQDLLLEYRECFPPLPDAVDVRSQPALTVSLHGGKIRLRGRPDLAIGRAQAGGQRRLLLIDLKAGGRDTARHRGELRFYALLAALKYGVAPFRIATFYLDEGDWDAEDVDAALLADAATCLVQSVQRAARLRFARPALMSLQLVAGPACNWCSRAPDCPAAAQLGLLA